MRAQLKFYQVLIKVGNISPILSYSSWLDYRICLIESPGFYFSKWILGEVQFKKSLKSGLFNNKKVGFYSRKTPKTGLFTLPGALFKSGVVIKPIRYFTKAKIGKLQEWPKNRIVVKTWLNFSFWHIVSQAAREKAAQHFMVQSQFFFATAVLLLLLCAKRS